MNRKFRVIAFMEAGVGGAEHVLLAYLSVLQAQGWDAKVLVGGTLSERSRETLVNWGRGLEFIAARWRQRGEYPLPVVLPSLDRCGVREMREALVRLAPDLVLINQPGPDDAQAAIRAVSSLRSQTKVVCLVHLAATKLLRMRLRRIKLAWAGRLYRSIDKVITVSNASARSLVEDYGVPERDVQVVWNGAEDVAPVLSEEDRRGLRLGLGVSESEVMVFWAGRFAGEKGVDVLLDAADIFRRRSDGIKVVLAGNGPLAQEMSRRHPGLTESGAVRFLGWRSDVSALLQASDIVAMPSRVESFPLLLLEAECAGKPIVASGVHGIPEIVVDGETGILVPPGDPQALAGAVERLARDPELRAKMGAAGRRRYEEHFTLEKAVDRFEAVLLDVLAGS